MTGGDLLERWWSLKEEWNDYLHFKNDIEVLLFGTGGWHMSIAVEKYEVGDANGVVLCENWSVL